MNCDRIERLLALEDDDARVDHGELRAHFASCGFCRRAFPEVFALSTAPDPRAAPLPSLSIRARPRRHEVAAAALVAAALIMFWSSAPPPTEVPKLPEIAASFPHSLTVTRIEWIDGRPITSRLERSNTIHPTRSAR